MECMVPQKNNIWWYKGHRRMVPAPPYKYDLPDLRPIGGSCTGNKIEKPTYTEPIINPVQRNQKKVTAPLNQETLF